MIELRWCSWRREVRDADLAMCCEFGGFDLAAIAAAATPPSVATTAEEFHRAMLLVDRVVRPGRAATAAIECLRALVERSVDEPFGPRPARAVLGVLDEAVSLLDDGATRDVFETALGERVEDVECQALRELVSGAAELCRLTARDGYLLVR